MTEELFLGLKYVGAIATAINKAPWYRYYFNQALPAKEVLLVGESGSGKSQFIEVLRQNGGIVESSTMLATSIKITLPSGRRIRFTDTPGQQSLQSERNEVVNDLCKKKYDGVINVVCYGYQVTSDTNEEDVFQNGTTNVKPSYLDSNRKKELKQVEEWLPRIDQNSSVKWVLTIVNKADIWYDKKQEVVGYYDSIYRDLLSSIKNFKKTPIVAYCCVFAPFCKKPMTITMGDKEKSAMHYNLYETLSTLMNISWQ